MKYNLICLLLICFHINTIGQNTVSQQNLGKNINSQWTETAPVISADGQTLYFVREKHPDNDCNQAVWYSNRVSDSTWSVAKRMEKPFNKEENNFISSASANGNTLLVPNSYFRGDYVGKGYSLSHKTKKGWSKFERLLIKDYDDIAKGNFAFAHLSSDEKKIVMCFSPTGINSNNDLYISFKKDKKNWTKPVSLGVNLNSKYNEITPFLASDGVTLYFSSNRPGGLGLYDIYRCKRLDNTYTKWSNPINLGPQFNTKKSEAYYTLDAKSEYAYLASSNNSFGKKDIIRIKLETVNKPQPVALVKGTIVNTKGTPISATITYELLSTGKIIGQTATNPQNGSYKIVLPRGNEYGYTVKAKKHFPISANLDLSDTDHYKEIESSFHLQPIKTGESVRINNLFFEYSSANIMDKSVSELNRLFNLLIDYKKMEIEISGHTDNKGNTRYNKRLSEKRAEAVKAFLVKKGINAKRITTIGHGYTLAKTSNENEKGRSINRRVEFKVIKR